MVSLRWRGQYLGTEIMIGNDGNPVARDLLRTAIFTYNIGTRGSKEFATNDHG
ncbi:hypothetical protein MCP1_560014 [Candidatus Terasakiella magnetica]|nr:hypothetical protein MCP1_560014 [Candidatus Terasakiella magnetica]